MREEKKYLVAEAVEHLGKSNYVFLAGFDRLTVADVAVLRRRLREKGAEYHVVKNSLLRIAAQEKKLPEFAAEALRGATAIVVGGEEPSEVAKILDAFSREKGREDKLAIKCGILEGQSLCSADVVALSKLPSLGELRSQMLSLFQAPARNLLLLCGAGAQGFVRLLVARAEKQG
jgi:large subunit ribosomal protein L10